MEDLQVLQSGPFFWKISLLDATCFDFAPWVDYDDLAAVLDSAQNAALPDENLLSACTLFFSARAQLASAKTWKDVLHSQENSQQECIASGIASAIVLACSVHHKTGFWDNLCQGLCASWCTYAAAWIASNSSSAGCPWTIWISPNFWKSHTRWYCPEENSMPNNTQSIPLF